MSANTVKQNERRFRRGALLLTLVAALSAGSTTALYYGIKIPFLYSTSLALPVVTDIALRTFFAGWIWMEKVRYYWFIGSSVLAAALGLIGMLCGGISLTGNICHRSFAGKSVNRVFSALGLAQLMSARALSAFGLLFYLLDGLISVGLVLASPQMFTPYYFFLLGNLLLHLVVLTFLGYSFTAAVGGGRASSSAPDSQDGDSSRV